MSDGQGLRNEYSLSLPFYLSSSGSTGFGIDPSDDAQDLHVCVCVSIYSPLLYPEFSFTVKDIKTGASSNLTGRGEDQIQASDAELTASCVQAAREFTMSWIPCLVRRRCLSRRSSLEIATYCATYASGMVRYPCT
jgi:hypothetical protein